MKAWITSLNDYNSGRLTGEWVDLDGTLWDSIEAFLAKRTQETGELHEEHAIHDYDDTPKPIADWLGEYPSKEQIELLGELSEDELDMWAAWIEHVGAHYADSVQEARDAYHGTCKSKEDFAEQLVEDVCDLKGVPEMIRYHIDWEGVARDLELGGDYSFVECGGEVHVFNNH